ncbi:MAG TPA: SAM-dependent methyltransferase [Candidatus Tumulicola sp.]|jgi:protein-L-isoaspartate O-methyltransferase
MDPKLRKTNCSTFEVVLVTRNRSLGAEYFDRLYSACPDPWNFETSTYETDKYRATVEALGSRHFGNALEIGCSIGVLTSLLADRCTRLLSIDVNRYALRTAKLRCNKKAGVTFARMLVPNDFPPGNFDLIVLSEVGYYWSKADLLRSIGKIAVAVQQKKGAVELVHYLPKVHDYPLSGDEVHDAFLADGRFRRLRSDRTENYRLDVLTV